MTYYTLSFTVIVNVSVRKSIVALTPHRLYHRSNLMRHATIIPGISCHPSEVAPNDYPLLENPFVL